MSNSIYRALTWEYTWHIACLSDDDMVVKLMRRKVYEAVPFGIHTPKWKTSLNKKEFLFRSNKLLVLTQNVVTFVRSPVHSGLVSDHCAQSFYTGVVIFKLIYLNE